jgi:hypothetical protein
MARVPLFQQDRLASSVVGTAGVDLSAARNTENLVSGIDAVTQQLAGITADQILQDKYAQIEARRKIDAANAALEKVNFESDVLAKGQPYVAGMTDAMAKIKQEKHFDTAGATEQFIRDTDVLIKQVDTDIPDDGTPRTKLLRAEIKKSLTQQRVTYGQDLSRWAESRQVPNTLLRIKSVGDSFANTFRPVVDGEGVLDLAQAKIALDAFNSPKTQALYSMGYGPAAPAEMRKAQEQGVRQYVAEVAASYPGQVETVLKAFEPYWDATDKLQYTMRIRAEAKEQQRLQDTQARITGTAELTDAYIETISKSSDGTLGGVSQKDLNALKSFASQYSGDKNLYRQAAAIERTAAKAGAAAKKRAQESAADEDVAALVGATAARLVSYQRIVGTLSAQIIRKGLPKPERDRLAAELNRRSLQVIEERSAMMALVKGVKDPAKRDALQRRIGEDPEISTSAKAAAGKSISGSGETDRVQKFSEAVRVANPYRVGSPEARYFEYYFATEKNKLYDRYTSVKEGDSDLAARQRQLNTILQGGLATRQAKEALLRNAQRQVEEFMARRRNRGGSVR